MAFVVMIWVATTIVFYYYFQVIANNKSQRYAELGDYAITLDEQLKASVQSIKAMHSFAQARVKDTANENYLPPRFLQDDQQFYLDVPVLDVINRTKHIGGNITGIGMIDDFSESMKKELAMAYDLTPAFITAKLTTDYSKWFYYVSVNRFVNLYPWIGRHGWQYSDRMLNNEHVARIRKAPPETVVWSIPYNDNAGTGIISSLGIGVYNGQLFKGALIIDIGVENISAMLPEVTDEQQGFVLLDKQYNVLASKGVKESKLTATTHWLEMLPDTFQDMTSAQLAALPSSSVISEWLLQKHRLKVNGWTLLSYQSYEKFKAPVLYQFLLVWGIALLVITAFFTMLYMMTRKTFIKPTRAFINHIEHCAQGDPGKIKPTQAWLPWFTIVEDIFSENRSLLQQLKDQNATLDSHVEEKTQALRLSVEQHQRDYALLRSVMNAIPDLILFNDLEGKLIGCNQAFERYVSQSEQNLLGQDASVYLPNKLKTTLVNLYQHSPAEALKYGRQELVETLDNTFEVYCAQFYNDAGETLGYINIIRDVTEQYAIRAALEQAKNQAEHANQAKNQFLANMSHEIRTPINAIQGMMSLLQNTALNAFQLQYLKNAGNASDSLLHLVDELLDLAKIESGNMPIQKQNCSLDEIVDKALKLNTEQAKAKQHLLTIEIKSDVPQVVLTDEMRLVQVLNNLLNNAIKFTKKGTITLTIDMIAESETNVLVRFKVTDNGIGIAQENQPYLFDVFRQADESMTRQYGGSGLGLAICQQIVNLLGGEITLISAPGQGSEFSFVLPFVRSNSMPSNEQTLQSLNIYSLLDESSQTFVQSVNAMGGKWTQCADLQAIANESQSEGFIVIVDSAKFKSSQYNESVQQQWLALKSNINLIAVCQASMVDTAQDVIDNLSALGIKFVLLELPLYRKSLLDVKAALAEPERESQATENLSIPAGLIDQTKKLTGVNILLVEDNLVNQLVAKELLANMGAEVVVAENGKVALNVLAKQTFDLVLMDIQMPVMDGLTATKAIRKQPQFKKLPIIAMTAHARKEDRDKSLASGMDMHIAKPISADRLKETICEILKIT